MPPIKNFLIVLDPGHGGHDPGAVNPAHGLQEKDLTLKVCQIAKALLAGHPRVSVILTREQDCFLSLSERAEIANEADAFVSYHFNSASSPDVPLSFEGFTTPGQNNSDRLAEAIIARHAKLFPEQEGRFDNSDGDMDKEANFAVIRRANCPSFLMEGEFIHTDHGAEFLSRPATLHRMAQAVAFGLLDFFDLPMPNQADDNFPNPTDAGGLILDAGELSELRKAAALILKLTEP